MQNKSRLTHPGIEPKPERAGLVVDIAQGAPGSAADIDKAALYAIAVADQRESALHGAALAARHDKLPALHPLAGMDAIVDTQKGRDGMVTVVIRSRLRLIEIITRRQYALMAEGRRPGQRIGTAPGLNHRARG